jgi:hypothetical protein
LDDLSAKFPLHLVHALVSGMKTQGDLTLSLFCGNHP